MQITEIIKLRQQLIPRNTEMAKRMVGTKSAGKIKSSDKKCPETKKCEPPKNWITVYENIRKMRIDKNADVDSIGPCKTPANDIPPQVVRYQTLIALMLSSQTKDPITFAAMDRLKDGGLTPEKVVSMNTESLEKIIYPVAFYKRKAVFLKKTTHILIHQYNGDIPAELDQLMALPGVGQKMAHICMYEAWNKVTGIGVDTHVHKVSRRLGWVTDSNDPDNTRAQLESWMPRERWGEVFELIAGFGQQICLSVNPLCSTCLNNNLCPKKFVKKHK